MEGQGQAEQKWIHDSEDWLLELPLVKGGVTLVEIQDETLPLRQAVDSLLDSKYASLVGLT